MQHFLSQHFAQVTDTAHSICFWDSILALCLFVDFNTHGSICVHNTNSLVCWTSRAIIKRVQPQSTVLRQIRVVPSFIDIPGDTKSTSYQCSSYMRETNGFAWIVWSFRSAKALILYSFIIRRTRQPIILFTDSESGRSQFLGFDISNVIHDRSQSGLFGQY